MVHIADTKVARRYGEFFIQQIHKFSEVSYKSEAFREKVITIKEEAWIHLW